MQRVEASAFDDHFRAAFPALLRYAQRQVGAADAEDLAAMTLEVIWNKNLAAPRDEVERRQLMNLSYRVLEGLIRNRTRAQATYRQALVRVGSLAEVTTTDLVEVIVFDEWPEWTRPLALNDRQILELVIDGYRAGEIAELLDCTPAAASMRIQRATKKARKLWTKGGESA